MTKLAGFVLGIAFVLLVAILVNGCTAEANVTPRAMQATVVRLQFTDGLCSGVVVGHHRVMTAEHCIHAGALKRVDDRSVIVQRYIGDGHDHVILTTDLYFVRVAKVRSTPLIVGERLTWWGNPAGLHELYREGYVAGYADDPILGHEDRAILIDGNSYNGDSGAALFDSHGYVCGIVSAMAIKETFVLTVAWRLGFAPDDYS